MSKWLSDAKQLVDNDDVWEYLEPRLLEVDEVLKHTLLAVDGSAISLIEKIEELING